jgi:membrane protein
MLTKFLSKPTDELGRWSRFLITQIRIWRQCFRLLQANQAFTQAAALAYHTLFGIVPLAIVMLMVFQMFPAYRDLGDKVRHFAYEQFNLDRIVYPVTEDLMDTPGEGEEPQVIAITEKIDELVERYMSKVSAGAITIVGVGLVIWAAVGLLMTIERTFNMIWHIRVKRSLIHRIVYYSWILMFGPILLVLGIYLSTQYLIRDGIESWFWGYVRPIFPFLVTMALLFFLYTMMPNTKVNPLAALWGAFIAAFLWIAAKYGFQLYLSKVIPYQAIYGILGVIPLSVFWIYVMWIIVLFGLQLTYATQHLDTLDAEEMGRRRRNDACFMANTQTIVGIMEYILNAFEQKNERPVTVEAVSARLDIPPDFTERLLDAMVKAGLLCHTIEPISGYVPSTDGAHITLADVSEGVSQVSFAQPEKSENPKLAAVFQQVRQLLDRYTLKDILSPWKRETTADFGQPPQTKTDKEAMG